MRKSQLKIGQTSITFVFKHRFEKFDEEFKQLGHKIDWRRWEISLWYRPSKIVGAKEFKDPNKWKNNLVRSHMIGLTLVIFKVWVEFHRGGLSIKA